MNKPLKLIISIIFSFFIFLSFNLVNVSAETLTLGTPSYYSRDTGGNLIKSGSSVLMGWWGSSNYYYSGVPMGNFGSTAPIIHQTNYQFINSNLCANKTMLIKGSIGGLSGFFTNTSNEVKIFNNGKLMSCTATIEENGSRLSYSCIGAGGGSYDIYIIQNSFPNHATYEVGVSRSVDVSCDASNSDVIQSGKDNTNSIINNNNQNQQQTNDRLDNIDGTLNNSDVSGANSDLKGFTDNNLFKDNTGLLAIIQLPFNMLNQITSSTCSPFNIPIPFIDTNIPIPCLSSVFSKFLPSEFILLIKLAINGFLIYRILTSFALKLHEYKDPDTDKLEVLDL